MKARHTTGGGSVLILALWTLFFLAALALAVGAHVAGALRLAGGLRQDAGPAALARAGVAQAMAVIAADTNAWDGAGTGAWNGDADAFRGLAVGDGAVDVYWVGRDPEGGAVTNWGVVGVESRLNINRADRRILAVVFRRLGQVSASRAEALVEALDAYRRAKRERERELTSESGSGYAPAKAGGGDVESLLELSLVDGMEPVLLDRLRPYLTVLGSGRLNVNAADLELMRCGAEAYPAARDAVTRIEEARRRGEVLREESAAGNVAFLTVRSTAFRGLAQGSRAGSERAAVVEFAVGREGRVLYWHEF